MKKLLASVSSFAILGSLAATVVACGPNVAGRVVDTTLYKGTFAFNMTTWSPQSSMQLEDAKILTHMNDTLITPNAYDGFEGALADWWTSDAEGTQWRFHVRDDVFKPNDKSNDLKETGIPYWTEVTKFNDVKQGEQIDALDFYNTFRFSMNPNNMADGTAAVNGFYKYSNDLSSLIDELIKTHPEYFDKNYNGPSVRPPNDQWDQKAFSTINIDTVIMLFNQNGSKYVNENASSYLKLNKTPDQFFASELGNGATLIEYLGEEAHNELVVGSAKGGEIIKAVGSKDQTMTNDTDTEHTYNLEINLGKKAKAYFESVLTFLPMSPMPDQAVNYYSSLSGSEYSTLLSPERDTMYYSGAYYVENYITSQKIELTANPFYYQKDNIHVTDQIYFYVGGESVDKPRLLFEAGDISEVEIKSTDLAGWQNYVGSGSELDIQNDLGFASPLTRAVEKQSTNTFFLLYNFVKEGAGKNKLTNSSKALALDSVRGYIGYLLDRNNVAKYYSGPLDNEEKNNKNVDGKMTSQLIRNSYTSKTLGSYEDEVDGPKKDYVDDMLNGIYQNKTDEVKKEIGLEDTSPDSYYKKYYSSLSDGYDAFYKNDLIALSIFGDYDNLSEEEKANLDSRDAELRGDFVAQMKNTEEAYKSNNQDALKIADAKKIEILQTKVWNDLKDNGINEKVTLEFLINGGTKLTINPYIKSMFQLFNIAGGDNSPIEIQVKETLDNQDYTNERTHFEFDAYITGWVPDYTDPGNFLKTITLGGDYASQMRTGTIFEKDSTLDEIKYKVKDEYVEQDETLTKLYEPLLEDFNSYTNAVLETDANTPDVKDRYKEFAQQEFEGVILNQFILPIYAPKTPKVPYLTYVNPFTRPSFASGEMEVKIYGTTMFSSLNEFTHDRYEKEKAKLDEYQKDEKQLLFNFDTISGPK